MRTLIVGLICGIIMVFSELSLAFPLPKACVRQGDCSQVKICCYSENDFGLIGRLTIQSRRGDLRCAQQACAYSALFSARFDAFCCDQVPKCNEISCKAFACPFQ